MIGYIERQGRNIVKIINELSNYASTRKKPLTVVIDFSDYKYLNRKIKREVNNVVEIIVKYNEKNFTVFNVKKVSKNKFSGTVFLKTNSITSRTINKLKNNYFKDYEIVLINDIENQSLNLRNVIDKNNFQELDLFRISYGFESKFGCKHSSCLGNRFFIDKVGNVSYCYKEKSIIGNIFKNNLREILINSKEFNDLLQQAIKKRKLCSSNCKFFVKCQGGCVLEDVDCQGFLSSIISIDLDNIINNNFSLDDLHLSKENTILKYISLVRRN